MVLGMSRGRTQGTPVESPESPVESKCADRSQPFGPAHHVPGSFSWAGFARLIIAMAALICIGLGILSTGDRRDAGQTSSGDGNAHYDAGQVFTDVIRQINHRFTITNRSDRTLKLAEKRCTCTCTTGQLTPDVLRPGQAAFLDMSIRLPGSYSGKSSVRCELIFDDGSMRVCTISYESFPRIMTDLAYLDFGVVMPWSDRHGGAASQQSLQTHVSLFAPLDQYLPSLASIRSPEQIEAEVVGEPETSIIGKIQRRRYLVRFRAMPAAMLRRPGGAPSSTVNIVSDDGASAVITLSWRVAERYSCSPSPVSFGMVDAGGPPRKVKVQIKRTGNGPVEIRSIAAGSEYLEVRPSSSMSSGGYQPLELTLCVPPSFAEIAISGVVVINLADETCPALRLPWSAFVHRPAGRGIRPSFHREGS